jgi:hypothetical protein
MMSATGSSSSSVLFNDTGFSFEATTLSSAGLKGPTFQAVEMLKHEWRPHSCNYKLFDQAEAAKCLDGAWLHFDGDSVTRDMVFDLVQAISGEWKRQKTHTNVQLQVGTTTITLAWNPFYNSMLRNTCDQGLPAGLSVLTKPAGPDVWVWSSGVWMAEGKWARLYATAGKFYRDRFAKKLECVARQRKWSAPKRILRTTAPRTPKHRGKLESEQLAWTRQTEMQALRQAGWDVLDTWPSTCPRPETSRDGTHFTGGACILNHFKLRLFIFPCCSPAQVL